MTANKESTISKVVELGPWFHQIDLGDGLRTRDIAPFPGPQPLNHPLDRWLILEKALPSDLRGLRVLDVGCADGFFALQLARRGAEVVAVDAAPKMIARLEWLIGHFGIRNIKTKVATIESLAGSKERYDFVFMIALLYHLRHPLMGLDIAFQLTDLLYVESVVHEANDDSYLYLRPPIEGVQHAPKWIPTEKCVLDMLAFSGFREVTTLERPARGRGLYVAGR
jgi:tRNA (mo5U34)-methyltransferase